MKSIWTTVMVFALLLTSHLIASPGSKKANERIKTEPQPTTTTEPDDESEQRSDKMSIERRLIIEKYFLLNQRQKLRKLRPFDKKTRQYLQIINRELIKINTLLNRSDQELIEQDFA